MKISNYGRGVHIREVKGIDRFRELPNEWFGYTNLDLVIGLGRPREIDLIIVSKRRIYLIDIKDWSGRIETVDNNWTQNGIDRGQSPVRKISGIARELSIQLKNTLAARRETKSLSVPTVTGLVVLTGNADRSGIAPTEVANVLTINEFMNKVSTDRAEQDAFGYVAKEFFERPLTGTFWKEKLGQFFTGTSFKPGKRRFQSFVAEEAPTFEPPHSIYREYDVQDEGSPNNLGTLRLWDFSKCPDARFQSEEGRLEIAGREQEVFSWLRDRGEEVERTLLTPKIDDPERGVNYWEIYDRRKRMQRLGTFAATEAKRLLPAEKIELARQLLSAVAGLHRQDAAHLDLDAHSIWLESPTTVKISHLLTAKFPEVRSLGKNRYQFLSSAKVPEDYLDEDGGPKTRDVFLLGVAVHLLLFGRRPEGKPPEWKPEIDEKQDYVQLHGWFSRALDIDPGSRFPSAVEAHEAFVRATAARPTPDEVIAGLESFRSDLRTLRQFLSAYPCVGDPIKETDSVEVWRSELDGESVVVKLWKQAAWGDTRREGGTILSFLQHAAALRADRPHGVPIVKNVMWRGDSFSLVQAWIEGPTLAEFIAAPPDENRTPLSVLELVAKLITVVEGLHDQGYSHGDLKPENIVITPEADPVLIDLLDFSPSVDGEIISSAYAPASGNKLERDRYALTKIAQELFALCQFDTQDAVRLETAVRTCREKEPQLATLEPLSDAVAAVTARLTAPEADPTAAKQIQASIIGAATGLLEPDEGYLFLRLRRDFSNALVLHIRGAREEIALKLGNNGNIASARRSPLEQRWIARNARDEFHRVDVPITVVASDISNLGEFQQLLDDPVVKSRIEAQLRGEPSAEPQDQESVSSPTEDDAEDLLVEEIGYGEGAASNVDVPLLWRALIDIENELKTEAVARGESFYDRQNKLHRVPIVLDSSSTFDYARHDTVGVERQDGKGEWRRIGELDVQSSRSDMAAISTNGFGPNQNGWIDTGERLRFVSHLEVQSLRRRTSAVERILDGTGRLTDLLSVFDPRSMAEPSLFQHELDRDLLRSYELNDDQSKAFEHIVRQRPVGLLQGPPGTGKTRFIAALAHYAITKKLARNVLLTSQSHEAVNTAADSVLKHFRGAGVQPSLLRVAMSEDLVSSDLRPHYTQRVEQAMKDRFRASFKERLAVIGDSLGLPHSVVDDVVIIETVVRPICQNIAHLVKEDNRDSARINSLIDTLRKHLGRLDVEEFELHPDESEWDAMPGYIAREVNSKHRLADGVDADRIERLRIAAGIGRDFMASTSRSQRSFEAFLAGTRQIVVGTCVGLGRTSLGLTATPFDLVIVDEAARCTASELLVPLQAARWAVLVGDHAQLKPQHKAEVVSLVAERTGIHKHEIQRSDFERVFTTGFGAKAGSHLKTQYRMLPPINRLVSEAFYSDIKLKAGRNTPVINDQALPKSLSRPLVWVETDGLGEAGFEQKDAGSHSRTNRAEADAILAELGRWLEHEPFQDWLLTQEAYPAGIGIICMYAAQRELIRRKLRQSSMGHLLDSKIKVGTVDSYQGKENPIIILSLVRNNDSGISELGMKRIREGFLAAPNRINVAASRAMDRLVIVGARKRWRMDSPLGKLCIGFDRLLEDGEAMAIDAASVLMAMDKKPAQKKRALTQQVADGGTNA
ncbi:MULTISPECIES: AAA domain-containing protein [unclassified Mesorhizobium]|uniref:AAA domain-containing protein n=1 Tax=unclassified Mesorhizobium TaxID=325217 RepID=UPI0024171B25|nr:MULTISPECIES: AAA domain-containing protein [unclassified Mesorhizobium]MDG4901402.1 AAA domain-containing protein [Mesorhizobium sp. WSM4962]MDG4918890.1 AAA domain-containing protein [Mesorhizobium sp. WSM4989]